MKLSESINNTRLSARSVHALHRIGICTIEQLLRLPEERDLMAVKNLGSKSVQEILDFISDCNAYFNTVRPVGINEWARDNQSSIAEYAKKHDISIHDMELSTQAFNTLLTNEVLQISELLIKTPEEIEELCFDNRKVAAEIASYLKEWLFINREKIECEQMLCESDIQIDDSHLLINSGYKPANSHTKDSASKSALSDESNKAKFIELVKKADITIEQLDLSVRTYNCLKRANLIYFSDVISYYPNKFLQIRNMGVKSDEEIKRRIEDIYNTYSNSDGQLIYEVLPSPILDAEEYSTDIYSLTTFELFSNKETSEKAWEYISLNDISISQLNLSNRSWHALINDGYTKFSSLLSAYPFGLYRIRNLGAKSISEIKSVIKSRLERMRPAILAYCSGDNNFLIDDSLLEDNILQILDGVNFSGISFTKLRSLLPSEIEDKRIKNTIARMINDGRIEYLDFYLYRVYPSFLSVAQELSELLPDSRMQILIKRYNGDTLETVAQSEGLTRERVRQLCEKQFRSIKSYLTSEKGLEYFDEDYYGYLYSNYKVPKELLAEYLNIPTPVISYLKIAYNCGERSLDDALEDSNLDLNLKLRIREFLNRNKVEIDGELVVRSRVAIEEYVLEHLCRDELEFSEFCIIYNDIINKYVKSDQSFLLTEELARTRINRLSESRKCLWKLGERLRYYDIDARNYEELLAELNLGAYSNTEISTLKFIEDNPDIMQKYDIRDRYELHNLLKKIVQNGEYQDIHFSRQPVIGFGTFDRADFYRRILNAVSPVTADELAEFIHMENGFDKATILSSSEIRQLSQYYHNGIFSIDFEYLSDGNTEKLNSLLTNDFYYLDEISDIFKENVSDADTDSINPRVLKVIGFSVYSNYAIRNHSTADAYFRHILTKDDVFDITQYNDRYGSIVMYKQVLSQLKKDYEILQIGNNQYVNFRRLAKIGISKNQIIDYCEEAGRAVASNSYFTIFSLKAGGFSHEIDALGFEDDFYSGILSMSPLFCHQRVNGNTVFYNGENNTVFPTSSFIESILRQYESVDVDEFIEDVDNQYGVHDLDRYEVIYATKGTDLYYDSIMNRIYSNKEFYYSEFDD